MGYGRRFAAVDQNPINPDYPLDRINHYRKENSERDNSNLHRTAEAEKEHQRWQQRRLWQWPEHLEQRLEQIVKCSQRPISSPVAMPRMHPIEYPMIKRRNVWPSGCTNLPERMISANRAATFVGDGTSAASTRSAATKASTTAKTIRISPTPANRPQRQILMVERQSLWPTFHHAITGARRCGDGRSRICDLREFSTG